MNIVQHERYRYPIPTKELERRWSLIRKAMKEDQIDCLIMQNDNQMLSGYVRYFTDNPASGYRTTVLFPANDEMVVINHGGSSGRPPTPPDWAARGIGKRITMPYIQLLHYANTWAAEAASKWIKEVGYKKIGFIGLDMISAAFYQYVRDARLNIEIMDASNLVDEIKAIKSPDEILMIRRTIQIHDYLAEAMPVIFRPGRYEYEVKNELKRMAADLGSEEQNIILGTDPIRPVMTPPIFQNRMIKPNDQMVCLIEVNGPGGYWGELARCWSLGTPSQTQVEAFEVSKQAQLLVAAMLKPGVRPVDLFNANNDFLISHGYAPEERLFGHGQGYDIVERPAFTPQETMDLKEGMLVAVHPQAVNKEAFTFCCDNYLITEDGAELLSRTPQEILVV